MVTLLDTLKDERPRHPEKEHRPDQPVLKKPDWIRVRASSSPVFTETKNIVKENNLVTVCEEAGLSEHWRVLVQETRHHDDHGRYLHPRLRFLQRPNR